ncbi:MAG TPA: hypothetical protein DCK98_02590 [Chloroflexi bacterium]|jgi:reactive intermediate/imine deaminase|nr:hypothetical protein [Chloroflexota bacterium]HAL26629.1 hypothetical protein [Chloroflexota bacterium]
MPKTDSGIAAVSTDKAPAYLSFMAQGLIANGFVFTAAIPRHAGTLEIPATFNEQANLAFRNLAAVLDAAGASMHRLVKLNVYLASLADWAAMNEVYKQYVNLGQPPVRCTVQIAGLNNGYLIELDAIALASSVA